MDNNFKVYNTDESDNSPKQFYEEYLVEQQNNMFPVPSAPNYLMELNTWNWDNVWQKCKVTRHLKANHLHVEFNYPELPILAEAKAYMFWKISKQQWGADATVTTYNRCLDTYLAFIAKTYPNIESCTEIPLQTMELKWHTYLEYHYDDVVPQQLKSFIKIMYQTMDTWIAKKTGTIWEKDIWVYEWLEEYNLHRTRSSNSHQINFSKVESPALKKLLKKYTKQRLLSRTNYTWGSAQSYNSVLIVFLNSIYRRHSDWTDLNNLAREDILAYHNEISTYNAKDKASYVSYRILIVRSFLEYIQLMDFEEQPHTPILRLILSQDIPTGGRNKVKVERYIPENVLSQIYANISCLQEDVRLVIIIMHNTGLRISDTLELTTDCLDEKSGQYWIQTDIMKTKLKNHRMPITTELAEMIKERCEIVNRYANEYHNPNHYLFPSSVKATEPMSQDNVLRILNIFADECNITDTDGKIYRFHNHAFRHTFAVSCLNNGMDILTLQELLGHASGDMTLYYAKLFDSTKREMFEKVVESGVFSFNTDTSLKKADVSSIIKTDLDDFWLAFKMNAIDTPYGVCMQRSEGKCKFAKQPPCLTCNGGKPCKNLCIGINTTDSEKYKVLMRSASSMMAIGEKNGNEAMTTENKELFNLYQEIYNTISSGSIIYGRADRLKSEIKKTKGGIA